MSNAVPEPPAGSPVATTAGLPPEPAAGAPGVRGHSPRGRRLFVALEVPPDVAAPVRRATAPLRREYPELRWSDPGSWHVTLCFLGAVPDDAVEELERRLSRVAARHPAVRLAVDGAGRFGDRVLWAGVREQDAPELPALAAGLRRAAQHSGLVVEDRPWRGHLTLALATPEPRARGLLAAPVQVLADLRGPLWLADRIQLVHSVPQVGGSRYQQVGWWPLTGTAHRH